MRLVTRWVVVVAASLVVYPAAAQEQPAAGAAGQGPSAGSKGGSAAAPPQGAAAPRAGDKAQPRAGAAPAAARDLAKALVSSEDWNRALDQYSTGLARDVTQSLSQRGEPAPDGLQASLRKELGQALPYERVLEQEAQALAKQFSPDELKRATAFYTSPLGRKAAQAVPKAQAELGRELQDQLATAVPQIVQRLAPKAIATPGGPGQGGAGAGGAAAGGEKSSRAGGAGGPAAPPSGSGSSASGPGAGAPSNPSGTGSTGGQPPPSGTDSRR
jgi:hypothetical protein